MPSIKTNATQVVKKLKEAAKKYGSKNRVIGTVGYTASYASYVHENLEAHHPHGKAKFLSEPLRTEESAMADIARNTIAEGGTLSDGIEASCNHLKEKSQELVPVDTGMLKASAYVEVN